MLPISLNRSTVLYLFSISPPPSLPPDFRNSQEITQQKVKISHSTTGAGGERDSGEGSRFSPTPPNLKPRPCPAKPPVFRLKKKKGRPATVGLHCRGISSHNAVSDTLRSPPYFGPFAIRGRLSNLGDLQLPDIPAPSPVLEVGRKTIPLAAVRKTRLLGFWTHRRLLAGSNAAAGKTGLNPTGASLRLIARSRPPSLAHPSIHPASFKMGPALAGVDRRLGISGARSATGPRSRRKAASEQQTPAPLFSLTWKPTTTEHAA